MTASAAADPGRFPPNQAVVLAVTGYDLLVVYQIACHYPIRKADRDNPGFCAWISALTGHVSGGLRQAVQQITTDRPASAGRHDVAASADRTIYGWRLSEFVCTWGHVRGGACATVGAGGTRRTPGNS